MESLELGWNGVVLLENSGEISEVGLVRGVAANQVTVQCWQNIDVCVCVFVSL